jgi:hypothetical protein
MRRCRCSLGLQRAAAPGAAAQPARLESLQAVAKRATLARAAVAPSLCNLNGSNHRPSGTGRTHDKERASSSQAPGANPSAVG